MGSRRRAGTPDRAHVPPVSEQYGARAPTVAWHAACSTSDDLAGAAGSSAALGGTGDPLLQARLRAEQFDAAVVTPPDTDDRPDTTGGAWRVIEVPTLSFSANVRIPSGWMALSYRDLGNDPRAPRGVESALYRSSDGIHWQLIPLANSNDLRLDDLAWRDRLGRLDRGAPLPETFAVPFDDGLTCESADCVLVGDSLLLVPPPGAPPLVDRVPRDAAGSPLLLCGPRAAALQRRNMPAALLRLTASTNAAPPTR